MAESTEKMITEYIIPNSIQHMDWQSFRDDHLWTLEVDDLYKANQIGVEKLF